MISPVRRARWWMDDRKRQWWRLTDRVSYDAVDLDGAMIDWLLPRLRYLRQRGHGYPFVPVFGGDGEMQWDGSQPVNLMTKEAWDAILAEMIEGFELADADDDWSPEAQEKKRRAANLLGEWLYALWM